MYEFIPKRTNNKARNSVMLLFFGSFALLFLTTAQNGLPFRWALQLIAVALLTVSIFLTTRYLTKIYVYRIESSERGADLVVLEAGRNGRKRTTVCRIALSGISRRYLVDASDATSDKSKEIKKQGLSVYDYRPDLNPQKSILIIANEGGEELGIRLAYDKTLYGLLAPQNEKAEDETDEA